LTGCSKRWGERRPLPWVLVSEPRQSPEEVTQNLPRFPPRPTDTAPLYPADELMKLQSIMDNRQGQLPPPPPPRKTTWVGKALALVGVAVVSGFVWWVLQPSDPVDQPVSQPQKTAGEFEFTSVPQLPEPADPEGRHRQRQGPGPGQGNQRAAADHAGQRRVRLRAARPGGRDRRVRLTGQEPRRARAQQGDEEGLRGRDPARVLVRQLVPNLKPRPAS
jgi:hypothetical protein